MLKGDIGLLAENVGVSKTTIYRIAEKIGLDLAPIHGRCDKTVDTSLEQLWPMSGICGWIWQRQKLSRIGKRSENGERHTRRWIKSSLNKWRSHEQNYRKRERGGLPSAHGGCVQLQS